MTNPHVPQQPWPGHQQPPQYPQGPNPPQYPMPAGYAGAPNQPGGYYPPRPPQKSNTGKILLIIFAVLVVLCGIGGILSDGGDKKADKAPAPTTSVAPEGAPAAVNPPTSVEVATPGLNTPVRDGKFEFVVTGVQAGVKTIGDNPYLQKTAQGAYLIVSITITNIADVPKSFSPGNQHVFDDQNRKFGNDSAAAINLQADTSLYAEINPGNTITAQVVFDMPVGAVPDRIELHDSMFSGGTDVALR
ncbi:DUF4352 domain-containing protein [Nocardia sp. NPDC055321]